MTDEKLRWYSLEHAISRICVERAEGQFLHWISENGHHVHRWYHTTDRSGNCRFVNMSRILVAGVHIFSCWLEVAEGPLFHDHPPLSI